MATTRHTKTKDLGIKKKSSENLSKRKNPSNVRLRKSNNLGVSIVNSRISVNGVTIPPPNPPQNMNASYSGIMLGTGSKGFSSMSFGTGNGKIIISAIRINGQIVLENFEIDPKSKLFSFTRKDNGLFIGTTKLIDCNLNDSISVDHVYTFGTSKLSMFYF